MQNFDNKDDEEDEYKAGVEVRDIECCPQASDERVRPEQSRHDQHAELVAGILCEGLR